MKIFNKTNQEETHYDSQKLSEKEVLAVSDNIDLEMAKRQRFRLDRMKKASEIALEKQKNRALNGR